MTSSGPFLIYSTFMSPIHWYIEGVPGLASILRNYLNIGSALNLNAIKTVQESTTQQPLTLFQVASFHGGTFNISV